MGRRFFSFWCDGRLKNYYKVNSKKPRATKPIFEIKAKKIVTQTNRGILSMVIRVY
jgi:hypothetical protein